MDMILDRAHITDIVEGVIEVLKCPTGALGLEIRESQSLGIIGVVGRGAVAVLDLRDLAGSKSA